MEIGQILKPQGIKGELKVKPLTDDPARFSRLKAVDIDNKQYRVDGVNYSGGFVFVKLLGVSDRNAAELLRGKFMCVERAAAVNLEDGAFFVSELLGAALYSRGEEQKRVGVIKSVKSFGAADVFEVKTEDGKNMSFAFVKKLEPIFDAQNKTFSVLAEKLAEVAVYED